MHPVFIQTIYYAVVMIMGALIIGFMQRGFFWRFVKVKLSFGRLVLVKIREVNRDLFRWGQIEEGFLVYKLSKKKKKRISVTKKQSSFYKIMGITCIDVDGETNGICTVDYEAVTGFDGIKWNNLYLRALTSPTIAKNRENIVLGVLVVMGILLIISLIMIYTQNQEILVLQELVKGINKGLVTAGGSL